MAKRKFKRNEQAKQALQAAYQPSAQGQARTRYQALRRYGERYSVPESETICGGSPSSLMVWCRIDQREGLAG